MAVEPDILPVVARGEGVTAIRPMRFGEGGPRFRDVVDLALGVAAKSIAF